MKRRLLTVALAICAAVPMMAQGGPGGGRGNRVDFLAGYLSLTDVQKADAKAIFDAAEAAAETVSGELTSANDALRAAIKAGKTDTELDTLSAAIGALQGKLTAILANGLTSFNQPIPH